MTFSLIETLAIAAGGILLGKGLVRLFPFLQDLCLPEPVLGGLLLCVLFSLSEFFGAQPLQFDLTLQTPLMIAFFLSIGWMASWKNLRAGGSDVIKFFLLCGLILVSQNLIGMGLAKALGQNPLVGALAGSVSLAGGPGTALAFAPAFEKAGVVGAGPIGTAAALAGIIMGGLLGSPLAARLISRFHLQADRVGSESVQKTEVMESPISMAGRPDMDMGSLMNHLKFFFLVMALGAVVGQWILKSGIILPIYIGAMIVAALLRNWHDLGRGGAHKIKLSHDWIEELGSIALSYFLVTATMTLQLKQLAGFMAGVPVLWEKLRCSGDWGGFHRIHVGHDGQRYGEFECGHKEIWAGPSGLSRGAAGGCVWDRFCECRGDHGDFGVVPVGLGQILFRSCGLTCAPWIGST